MPVQVIVGAQWGDEGKGKVTDYLTARSHLVVRAQGGNNAGHTVVVGSDVYKLHLLPSGILHPEIPCLITDGVAINPTVILDEITRLRDRGIPCTNLTISPRCHVILPYHVALDEGKESHSQTTHIGTTRRGNGPVFADKMSRTGIRLGHLAEPDTLRRMIGENLFIKNTLLRECFDHPGFDADTIMHDLLALWPQIAPYVADTQLIVRDALRAKRNILVEGAQGVLLDINSDMYPYVTSSHPGSSGATLGTGIPVNAVTTITGVVKAYTTRVGVGPFPTELNDAQGDALRERGGEYGTTTGRPRRIGWLDLPLLRYAVETNGMTEICLTKVDVLDGLAEIPVCVGYDINGVPSEEFPHTISGWDFVTARYAVLPGWQ
ncbi:MAG: adenylosuccinate synthase, partial [bacterium]